MRDEQAKKKTCPRCGHRNSSFMARCLECGTALDAPPDSNSLTWPSLDDVGAQKPPIGPSPIGDELSTRREARSIREPRRDRPALRYVLRILGAIGIGYLVTIAFRARDLTPLFLATWVFGIAIAIWIGWAREALRRRQRHGLASDVLDFVYSFLDMLLIVAGWLAVVWLLFFAAIVALFLTVCYCSRMANP